MKRSQDRILTTHVGSIGRPDHLLDLLGKTAHGGAAEQQAFAEAARHEVIEVIRRQVEAGIDIVTDGEMSKSSFFGYIRDRLGGFEETTPPPGPPAVRGGKGERAAFPEFYAMWDKTLPQRA